MKHCRFPLAIFLMSCFIVTAVCSQNKSNGKSNGKIHFSGSTPCDPYIQSLLKIPAGTKCEFIKWELNLDSGRVDSYQLVALYGEALPNTNGFIAGGNKIMINGNYLMDRGRPGSSAFKIYNLHSNLLSSPLSLIEMDKNILHLANSNKQLLVGNGGFGYVLNRIPKTDPGFARQPSDTSKAVAGVFDGRTPCNDLADQLNEKVTETCTKIKWRLTLYQDGNNTNNGSYELFGFVYKKDQPRTGTWHITKGTKANPDATVLQLDQTGKFTLFLQKADNNVLFFLDREKNLLVGNRDFSYTLNRIEKPSE